MDQSLFHLINEQWTSPALDLFMAALSDVQIWKPLLIALVLYALIFRGFKGRAFVLCVGVTLLISDAIVVKTLKSAVGRLRPKQAQTVRMVQLQKARPRFLTLFKEPTIRYSGERDWEQGAARGRAGSKSAPSRRKGNSFPSGHVTDNVVIATCCTLFFRRWGWLCFLLAGCVGYSRIYLGAHWPSDVLGTAFLAAGETLLVIALLELLWRRVGPVWAPGLLARYPRLIGDR